MKRNITDEVRERELHRERLVRAPKFDVDARTIQLASGEESVFVTVEHPGAVVIVAQDALGRIVLERQWRRAADRFLIELPAGTLEVGEPPLDCAKRELREETGYAAALWGEIGVLFPAPGFCTERQYGFYANGLVLSSTNLDADEQIETLLVYPHEFEEMVARGEIQDGKSIAFFYFAKNRGWICR